ncbi:MAG TPA: SusC/RagA family TonB-linked outer membrane protein [Bacteroidetes bacterium]|nr:SusC/RagA family TonB-linked outer membrane protein [Bacteroidota bacterium]
MKKLTLIFSLFVLGMSMLVAQTVQITGTVTDEQDGTPIPGVSVVAVGTTIGTTTDVDGNYRIIVPSDVQKLEFSFIGMRTIEVDIAGQTEINVTLAPDIFGLDEVIVTGVASMTPKKKLSISVDQISEERLKEVPAISAASALQGKVSGLTIVQANGSPGSAASIRLRGATTLYGSQAPLIIVDGVMLEGTLADINVNDIQTMEVVKGAAASALYGSRAGNGVISIQTKRGQNIGAGQTTVTARTEFGESRIARKMPVSKHHVNKLADDWASEDRYTKYYGITTYGDLPSHTNPDSLGYVLEGGLTIDPDHYMDNEYGLVQDQLDLFYQPGNYSTNYVSVATNTGKTNFMASFEHATQTGVVFKAEGYKRNNFRINVDHKFSDKFTFSTSNLVIKTFTDAGSMDFFSLLQLQPDMDLLRKNPVDGSDYRLDVDQFGTTINPLYLLANTQNEGRRNRILSSYKFNYMPFDWLNLEGHYSFEKQDNYSHWFREKGYLILSGYVSPTGGQLSKSNSQQLSQVFQMTANFNEVFGDFTTKGKLSYLYESNAWESFSTGARDFGVAGVPQFGNTDQTTAYNSSSNGEIRAENIFGIIDVDYRSKYITSFLYRIDGASQFGEEERYNPYFRISGAWRISEDVSIPGINELKIRAAYGTAGHRPPWNAQYETFTISGGVPVMNVYGNKNLKPTTIKETEVALNVDFLDRFSFEFIYSKTDAEDQHWRVPLAASAGFQYQWQNMGTLRSDVFEATLGAELVNTPNFGWNANLTWDRVRQKVTELNVAPFTTGARGNAGDPGVFFITEGAVFGTFSGEEFLRSMDDMAAQIALLSDPGERYEGYTIDDFTLNSDGYVIRVGTEGTVNEIPVKFYDESGNPETRTIGDANPDFRMSLANTFRIWDFSLYVLLDWKQGGDIYNLTNQWMYRDNRSADMDQFGKPANEKKAVDYYKALYNVNTYNNHFVEDGSYLKVRELAVYYNVNRDLLGRIMNGFIKNLRIGFTGRNLYTFTRYSGFDPEVGSTEGSGDNTIQAWDEFSYPNYRTLSGTIEIKF